MVNVGDGVADLMADVALQEGERVEEVAIQQPDIILSLSIVALIAYLTRRRIHQRYQGDAIPVVVSEGLEVQRTIEGVAEGE